MKSSIFNVTFLFETCTLYKIFVVGDVNCAFTDVATRGGQNIRGRPANITEKRKMLSEVPLFPVKDNEFWVE